MATLLAPSRTDRAFERLYRRYVADVYRYVLAVLQNEADAEDATQTAFLSAYRAYERGERPERPQHWLIAIAHNVCRQRFRESARRPRLVELDDEVPARPSGEEDAPNAIEIRRALGFLAFNQRAALVMRELQGRPYEEIAGILGLSTSAVETLLFRARRAMREQLEGALTCAQAELALSKRADGKLTSAERGPLRAHLRECSECAALERGQRFRRRALRTLGTVPVPSSLTSFFGGGAAVGTGVGVGAKAAAVVAAVALGTGLAGDAIRDRETMHKQPSAQRQHEVLGAQHDRSDAAERRAQVAGRLSFRRAAPARRRPPSYPSRVSSSPAAPQTASAALQPTSPVAAERAVTPSEPTPAAEVPSSDPAARSLSPLPSVPSLPLPQPPPVADPPATEPTPALPAVPEPVIPQTPALPQVPALPELPKKLPELPKLPVPNVKLSEPPRIDVPPTPTVVQP